MQSEFGEEWSSDAVDAAAIATPAPADLNESTATTSLALELTADGTIWRISPRLVRLLGFTRAQTHALFGHNLLVAQEDVRPCISAETRHDFAAAFSQTLRRLGATAGRSLEPSMRLNDTPILMLRPGGKPPLHLIFAFEETSKLTEHSVALVPTHEAHAAITVTFVDVTLAESAKQLVRRRIELSFNDKAADGAVAELFSPSFAFNAAGTQLPARADSASKQPIQRYLERRELLVRAFPDLRYDVIDQSCVDERVVTSWTWSGTHSGPLHFEVDGEFVDIAPTGRRVQMTGVSVDLCAAGAIVDHATYFDAGAILRQVRLKDGGSPGLADARAADDVAPPTISSKLMPFHRATKQLMDKFYLNKVLALLATSCNDLGFAICRKGLPPTPADRAACQLSVAISSAGFAHVLGLEGGDHSGLGLKLLDYLRSMALTSIQSDATEAVEALHDAAIEGRPCMELVTVCRGDAPQTLIVSLAPFAHAGLELVAVVVIAASTDGRGRSSCTANITRGDQGKEADTAACHFGWQHELLDNLSSQAGAHLGFGHEVLAAAVNAFDTVGFSLGAGNVAGVPLTWVSEGFVRLTGYSRSIILNRKCDLLQTDATDSRAIVRLRSCIHNGYAERVTLYNQTSKGVGFWNCVSLYPSLSGDTNVLKHCVAVQVRMDTPFYVRLAELQCAIAQLSNKPSAESSPRLSGWGKSPRQVKAHREPLLILRARNLIKNARTLPKRRHSFHVVHPGYGCE
mmetsp:Transcript_2816/g.8244  ORF Transcript_2816/g.8244 Transcript_2816/m.8244 type:complete len:743 (-) Transcript_2816:2018-4246(-)